MIITNSKDINYILKKIEKKPVFIMGCSECATICKTGGEKEVIDIIKYLKINGLKVTG